MYELDICIMHVHRYIHVLMSYISSIIKGLPFVKHKTVFKLLYFKDLELLFKMEKFP